MDQSRRIGAYLTEQIESDGKTAAAPVRQDLCQGHFKIRVLDLRLHPVESPLPCSLSACT